MVCTIKKFKTNKRWSFIWLQYVQDVNLNRHCKPCLIGHTSFKIGKYDKHKENIVLNESPARYYYLCGGSYPYKWKNNFHLAWEEYPGKTLIFEDKGIYIEIENAIQIKFSEEDIDTRLPQSKNPKFRTCRNWQFANKVYKPKNMSLDDFL